MELGIENTLKNGLYISLDWLSFTVKREMTCEQVIEFFGMEPSNFTRDLAGARGYRSKMRHMSYAITLLYDGREDMGIHVDVSGSAVGFFLRSYMESRMVVTPFNSLAYTSGSFDCSVFAGLLEDVLDMGNITRLDIAIDDKGANYYTMEELQNIFESGLYVSRFKKYRFVKEASKKSLHGFTIYLGSRKSNLMFRIYDKKLQCKKKNPDCSEWVRWEIELHDERATMVALMLIGGAKLSSLAIGVLSNYLRLIQRDNVRDSRCSASEKWDRFLNGIEKIRICQPERKKTLDDKKDWIERQIAPTIAAIYHADGDLEFIYKMVQCGTFRMSVELIHLIGGDFSAEGF